MSAQIQGPAGGRPLWHGLFRFWAYVLVGAGFVALLLQSLGPPLTSARTPMTGDRHSDRGAVDAVSAGSLRADLPVEKGIARPRVLADTDTIRNLLRSANAQPLANAVSEGVTNKPVRDDTRPPPAPPPALPEPAPADVPKLIQTKIQLYDRARAAAEAGDFDLADRVLALAANLPLTGSPPHAQQTRDRDTPVTGSSSRDDEKHASGAHADAVVAQQGYSTTNATSDSRSLTADSPQPAHAPATVVRQPLSLPPSPPPAHENTARTQAAMPAASPDAANETRWIAGTLARAREAEFELFLARMGGDLGRLSPSERDALFRQYLDWKSHK